MPPAEDGSCQLSCDEVERQSFDSDLTSHTTDGRVFITLTFDAVETIVEWFPDLPPHFCPPASATGRSAEAVIEDVIELRFRKTTLDSLNPYPRSTVPQVIQQGLIATLKELVRDQIELDGWLLTSRAGTSKTTLSRPT